MQGSFCLGSTVKNSSKGSFQWLCLEQEWDLRKFLYVTAASLFIGMTAGTSLAIALDIHPKLGICKALHSLKH